MEEKLSETFSIFPEEVASRKQFLDLTEEDFKVLKELRPFAKRVYKTVAKEFYDAQFGQPTFHQFFEGMAKAKGISLAQLREHLEQTQGEYFSQLFFGVPLAYGGDEWGEAYLERRLFVGKIHEKINLPLKWYLSSYALYARIVIPKLIKVYWFRPFFLQKGAMAIMKLMNLDMQLVSDAYVGANLKTLGMRSGQEDAFVCLKRNIFQLVDQVRVVSNGDLSNPLLDQKIPGVLGDVFSQMVRDLNGIVTQVLITAERVSASSQDLSSTAQEMNATTEEVSTTVQQIAKGAETTAQRVEETSKIMEQMNVSVSQVAISAQAAADASVQASQSAQKGGELAKDAVNKMNKIYETISGSAVVVKKLSDRSEQISEITDVITDIADQTNLLALNAAIEAARAGEQGRGFAVVAEEVRKLAEGSAKAADQIAKLIKEVQKETKQAVEAMDMGSKEVAEGREVVIKAGTALNEIIKVVENNASMVEQISAATEQMSAGTKQVVKSVDDIASTAEEAASATEEASASTEEMTASMQEMAASAQELAEMGINLRELVGKFKVGENQSSAVSRQSSVDSREAMVDSHQKKIALRERMEANKKRLEEVRKSSTTHGGKAEKPKEEGEKKA